MTMFHCDNGSVYRDRICDNDYMIHLYLTETATNEVYLHTLRYLNILPLIQSLTK